MYFRYLVLSNDNLASEIMRFAKYWKMLQYYCGEKSTNTIGKEVRPEKILQTFPLNA